MTGAECERFARMTIFENLFCGGGFTSFFLSLFASAAFFVSLAARSFSLRRVFLTSCLSLRRFLVSASSQAGEWQIEEASESSPSVLIWLAFS